MVAFFTLFAFPEKRMYRAIDFGNYLSLMILDTGHTCPIQGLQTQLLQESLAARELVPYKMAAYHVGAFPSFYSYKAAAPELLRKEWVPVFEKYQINFAFEHHNHAYKRTHPIKEEKIDATGVVYLGDGAWGVVARKPQKKLWYIAKSEQSNCFCLVTLEKEKGKVESFNNKGKIIDTVSTFPKKH